MGEENISNLILERLNRMDERLSNLEEMRGDIGVLKESVRRIDHKINYMDSYIAGFHSQLRWQQDGLDEYRGRLEDLEKMQKEFQSRDDDADLPPEKP